MVLAQCVMQNMRFVECGAGTPKSTPSPKGWMSESATWRLAEMESRRVTRGLNWESRTVGVSYGLNEEAVDSYVNR